MTLQDYYNLLDLPPDSSTDEIKKAYRKMARLYHPDINPSPDAKDKFIAVTEAYEFLISFHDKAKEKEHTYEQAMEDWRKYRQDTARRRATAYARAPYSSFKNSKFYKTTRIFEGTTITYSLIISIMVVIYTIYGYIYRLHNPIPGLGKPSVLAFILLLFLGAVFLTISMIYFLSYLEKRKKGKKKSA